jgi:hypothetical protein
VLTFRKKDVEPEKPVAADPPEPAKPAANCARPKLYVGFGKNGSGFSYILRDEQGREIHREDVTAENAPKDKPKGFFQSFARLFAGGPRT